MTKKEKSLPMGPNTTDWNSLNTDYTKGSIESGKVASPVSNDMSPCERSMDTNYETTEYKK